MAKKQSVQWHKKHIATRWGLAILSFLLLVTIILIPVLKQQQDSLIDAAGLSKSDQAIINRHVACTVGSLKGVCKQVSNTSTGFFASGHCPGSSAVQCYISSNVSCSTPVGKGTCHNTSHSAGSGKFVPGYCPGPSNVQCLVPHPTKQNTGGNSGSPVTSTSCGSIGGTCQSTSAHKNGVGGYYHSGYCPGGSTNQCWVPGSTNGRPPVSGCMAPNHLTNGFCCPSNEVGNTQEGRCMPANMHLSNGILCPIGSTGNVYTGKCVTCPAGYTLINKQGLGEICAKY